MQILNSNDNSFNEITKVGYLIKATKYLGYVQELLSSETYQTNMGNTLIGKDISSYIEKALELVESSY